MSMEQDDEDASGRDGTRSVFSAILGGALRRLEALTFRPTNGPEKLLNETFIMRLVHTDTVLRYMCNEMDSTVGRICVIMLRTFRTCL